MPIIFSTHPRTRKKINELKLKFNDLVIFNDPLGYFDYINLQKNSLLVISDSGTISEESSMLSFDAINLRESHERPEAMEQTPLIMSGLTTERVLQSISSILNNSKQILRL